jgi:hypothetical protein
MRPQIPPEPTPVLSGPKFQQHWYRFLQEFWESFGWNAKRPVYNTLYIPVNTSGAAAGTTSVTWSLVLPLDYKPNTDIDVSILWYPTSTNAGNVVFDIAHSAGSVGDTFPSDTTGTVTTAADGTASVLKQSVFTDIDGDSLERGDALKGTIARDGDAAADTYADAAFMLGLLFKYRIEGAGVET